MLCFLIDYKSDKGKCKSFPGGAFSFSQPGSESGDFFLLESQYLNSLLRLGRAKCVAIKGGCFKSPQRKSNCSHVFK